MLSYFQGIRPSGRRGPSTHTGSSQSSEPRRYINGSARDSGHLDHEKSSLAAAGVDAVELPTNTSSYAPVLPPIPHIAARHSPPGNGFYEQVNEGGQEKPKSRQIEHDASAGVSQVPKSFVKTKPEVHNDSYEKAWKVEPELVSSYRISRPRPTPAAVDESYEMHKPLFRPRTEPTNSRPRSPRQVTLEESSDWVRPEPVYHSNSYVAPPTSIIPNNGRHSKTKLNMLNPMSLLSRRRSAQIGGKINGQSSSHRPSASIVATGLPDDYDPRIRGKVVHDFSAPRPRHYVSANNIAFSRSRDDADAELKNSQLKIDLLNAHDGTTSDEESSKHTSRNSRSPDRQHTPIFKEHFGDDIDWRFDAHDRNIESTSEFAEQPSIQEPIRKRSPLPAFARNLPADITNNFILKDQMSLSATRPPSDALAKQPPPNTPPTTSPAPAAQEPSQYTPSPKARSRTPSSADQSRFLTAMPKHMTSNASRFSFDLAGVGSAAQEKLLEDKHRQQNARKTRESAISGASAIETDGGMPEDDDFDYDDIDFDDGLEEKIPGVNADFDEENEFSFESSPGDSRLQLSHDQANNSLPEKTLAGRTWLDEVQSPEESPTSPQPLPPLRISPKNELKRNLSQSDVIGETEVSNPSRSWDDRCMSYQTTRPVHNSISYKEYSNLDGTDLYFDDGLIDILGETDGTTFDESVFDDDTSRVYGLPLRDLKPLPEVVESSSAEMSQQSTRPISLDSEVVPANVQPEVGQDTSQASLFSFDRSLPAPRSSLIQKHRMPHGNRNPLANLTHDNLEAYHSALAGAANRAALDGKFDRKGSMDDGQDGQDHAKEQNQRIVSFDENQLSRPKDSFVLEGSVEDDNPHNFDDDLDDEAIIAAANAEALENDDEGFYGQEFGFFAHSNGSEEAQYVNGGYFGSSESNGIKRSHSGRANGQEPSLTPITERSEWSQRNSMISLAMHGGHPPPMQTPGLAQLADAIQLEDDNMSLSALMKLRRGAWGGSNTSLQSSGSQKSGAPVTGIRPVTPNNMPSSGLVGSNLAGSSYSLASSNYSDPDEDVSQDSPTLTLQTQGLVMPPGLDAPRSSGSDSSPKRRNAIKAVGHSRNSSGAESVSYVKELNEDGIGTWVLERRRTAEGGQMEVFGRQVVEGGRI